MASFRARTLSLTALKTPTLPVQIGFIEKLSAMAPPQRPLFVQRSWALHVSETLQTGAKGGLPVLSRLLECYSLDVNVQDYDGTTVVRTRHAPLIADRPQIATATNQPRPTGIANGQLPRCQPHRHPRCQPRQLHAAAEQGHLEAVALLLDRGADLSITSNCGDTALHGTCSPRNEDKPTSTSVQK